MYKGYTPSYTTNTNTNTPNGQVNSALARIEACYKQNELRLLIFLTEMCLQNFAESMVRLRLPRPVNDDNLSSTIH